MIESTGFEESDKLRPAQDNNITPEEPPKRQEPKWHIMLEPALVGAMLAINLGQTSLQNFYLRTACTVDLGFAKNICDSGVGESFRLAEADSQIIVSRVHVNQSFVGSVLTTAIVLFVGPWSDCSGRRKPLMILSLTGMAVMSTVVLLLITFPGASTIQVVYAVFIPTNLGGHFGLLIAAAFSHLGDVCHEKGYDVTKTMGTHQGAIQVGNVLGALSGPILYRHLGFYGVFPIVLFLQLSSLVYVIMFVKDVHVNNNNEISVFNWRLPLNAVRCLLRPREGNKRKIILLMTVVALGSRLLITTEVMLGFMFFRRKFNWDDILFGSYIAYRNSINFLGTLLILTVLKRSLNLSNEYIGVISCISYILSTSGLIAAQTTAVVFLVPVIGVISQGSQVVQRPILNKQILPTEQGKIYSLVGALQSATQTWTSPLYSFLYSKTVTNYPDAWLVLSIFVALLQLGSYLRSKSLQQSSTDNAIQEHSLCMIEKVNSVVIVNSDSDDKINGVQS